MPRIRTIKPELPEDELLGSCCRDARYLFVLLLTRADDHGRFRASPVLLKAQLYPYDLDLDPSEIGGWLDELARTGRVQVYEVEGQRYGHVVNWAKHQRIDNAAKAVHPPPPEAGCGDPPRDSADLGGSLLDRKGREGRGGEGKGSSSTEPPPQKPALPDDFDTFWGLYPRKVGKIEARKAWIKARRTADFDEIRAGLWRWLRYWEAKGDPEFIPHPTRWLNRGDWSSDPGPPPKAKATNGQQRAGRNLGAIANVLDRVPDDNLAIG